VNVVNVVRCVIDRLSTGTEIHQRRTEANEKLMLLSPRDYEIAGAVAQGKSNA
jgi:DNA-binding NarL/FixJ family response regulator